MTTIQNTENAKAGKNTKWQKNSIITSENAKWYVRSESSLAVS